jgi:ADP-ribose pyrophosphatase YjhB (NUDIX family)
MSLKIHNGKARPCCADCGYIQYLNPAPAAAVVIRRQGRICLVKRKYAPRSGMWTMPAGFMEYDEQIEETAVREVKEETGLDVRLTGLFAVHTGILPPDRPILLVVFLGEEVGGQLQAGDDAAEVGFFPLDDLPGEIAFATHRRVLADLKADSGP